MSESVGLSADRETTGEPERLHPFYLLTGLGQTVKGAWGVLAGGAYLIAKGQWWIAAAMLSLFALFSIASLFIRWRKFEYRVGPDAILIDSGFLSRTSRAIPFDRITDVDLEQAPLQRLLGLARVRFETGGSAGSKEEDGILHTIALARAEALREHIRGRLGQASARPPEESAAPFQSPPLFAMSLPRVATAGMFNFSLAVIAGLFGVTQTMGDVIGFDPFRRNFWMDVFERAGPLRALVIEHRFLAAVGGTVLLLLIGFGTGLIRTLLREYGFRLDRTDAGLRRRRGLLTLTDVTIPATRIQAAILATGPVRRAFGWKVLKLQSLAQDGGRGDHVVAPLATQDEAAQILASLYWPASPVSPWHRVSRAFVTSFATMFVPVALGALAVVPLLGPVAVLWILGAGIAVAARWFSWRGTRFALDQDMLFVMSGWWKHRLAVLPLSRIQSVDISESFWSRAFGTCTLRLGVAGGSGFSNHHIPALIRSDANSLRSRLLAE